MTDRLGGFHACRHSCDDRRCDPRDGVSPTDVHRRGCRRHRYDGGCRGRLSRTDLSVLTSRTSSFGSRPRTPVHGTRTYTPRDRVSPLCESTSEGRNPRAERIRTRVPSRDGSIGISTRRSSSGRIRNSSRHDPEESVTTFSTAESRNSIVWDGSAWAAGRTAADSLARRTKNAPGSGNAAASLKNTVAPGYRPERMPYPRAGFLWS